MINPMKTKRTIILLSALAAMSLASCDRHKETGVYEGAVRFTAGIGNQAVATPKSRAADAAWAPGDKIGIFMVKKGTTTIAEGALNKQHTTTAGDGAFTPIMGDEIYYPMDNSAVDFIAYYPYREGATFATDLAVEIASPQTVRTQADCDLMWAKANNTGNGYKKTTADAEQVALVFSHCLPKLTMNCKVDASVGAPSLLDAAMVTIHGMNTRSTFNLSTGTPDTPTTPADIIPHKSTALSGYDGAYDAIILPGTYAAGALTVDFTINGETYVWTVDAITFAAENEYIYDVNITRTGVSATGTIKARTTVKQGEVTAE